MRWIIIAILATVAYFALSGFDSETQDFPKNVAERSSNVQQITLPNSSAPAASSFEAQETLQPAAPEVSNSLGYQLNEFREMAHLVSNDRDMQDKIIAALQSPSPKLEEVQHHLKRNHSQKAVADLIYECGIRDKNWLEIVHMRLNDEWRRKEIYLDTAFSLSPAETFAAIGYAKYHAQATKDFSLSNGFDDHCQRTENAQFLKLYDQLRSGHLAELP